MFEPVYVGQLIKKGKSEFDFDSKEVVDLIVQAYDSKPEKVIAWLAGNLKIKESYVLVVRDCANNNRVVSILMYYPVSQDEIYIANLATREEYKRKGIAKFLIAWFKELMPNGVKVTFDFPPQKKLYDFYSQEDVCFLHKADPKGKTKCVSGVGYVIKPK